MVLLQTHGASASLAVRIYKHYGDRAASVVEALVQRGIARDRLRSAGYGERCPVDPASSPQAWERNRRVEFKIIATEDGPTGVQVACPAGADLVPR